MGPGPLASYLAYEALRTTADALIPSGAGLRLLEALTLALETRMRAGAERIATSTGSLKERPLPQHAALVARIRRFFGVKSG